MRRLYAKTEVMASHFHASPEIDQNRAEVLIANELLQKIRAQMVPLDGFMVIHEHGQTRSYTVDGDLFTRKEMLAKHYDELRRLDEAKVRAYADGEMQGYANGEAAGHQTCRRSFEAMSLHRLLRWWWNK